MTATLQPRAVLQHLATLVRVLWWLWGLVSHCVGLSPCSTQLHRCSGVAVVFPGERVMSIVMHGRGTVSMVFSVPLVTAQQFCTRLLYLIALASLYRFFLIASFLIPSTAKATFDAISKTYSYLTPDLWKETVFTKSPYQVSIQQTVTIKVLSLEYLVMLHVYTCCIAGVHGPFGQDSYQGVCAEGTAGCSGSCLLNLFVQKSLNKRFWKTLKCLSCWLGQRSGVSYVLPVDHI